MPLMLPATSASTRSVVGVADEVFAALRGTSTWFPAARSVVLVVVDGLGAISLRSHAGHARHLASAMGRKDVAQTVFPTTTAAALTSILTGVWPGRHGLVGYRVRDSRRDVLINQLTDWEAAGLDPVQWQAAPTVFERAGEEGRAAFAVGVPAYADTGFTRAVLRGAAFVSAQTPQERVAAAYELAAQHPGALVYCYLPECDKAGHKDGLASDRWIAALETIDAALAQPAPAGVGVVVTSDHGMLDVPAHRHVILPEGASCFEGVRHVGGEPRMLHVYLEPDVAPEAVAVRWQAELDGLADVGTKREAIGAGLFGPLVTAASASRIGDLLVIARGSRAVYDGRSEDQRAQGMIGQHGALTPEERQVPLIGLGAFARP